MTIAKRNKFLEQSLPLIHRCVNTFLRRKPWLRQKTSFDQDDLIQAGVVGLAEVLDSIDLSTINNLDAYLFGCVRRTLQAEVDAMGILPARRTRQIRRYWAVYYQLKSTLRREPTELEIANAMNETVNVIKRLIQDAWCLGSPASLDTVNDDGGTLHNVVSSLKRTYVEPVGPICIPGIGIVPDIFEQETVRVDYKRGHPSLNRLNVATTMVHIDGTPYLWLFKEILDRAPKVKIIRVIPTIYHRITDKYRMLCEEREVAIITGYQAPDLVWEEHQHRSPTYEQQRKFLLTMKGRKKTQFVELLRLKIGAAQMVERYFCLNREKYVPQRVIAEEFGLKAGNNHYVSTQVNAILLFLNYRADSFNPGSDPRSYVRRLEEQVRLKRKKQKELTVSNKDSNRRASLGTQLGVPALARKFPMDRLGVYRKLLRAKNRGKLDQLKEVHPRSCVAITLRFGLDSPDHGVYRTLQKVADAMGGITRERVSQLEDRALELLRIAA